MKQDQQPRFQQMLEDKNAMRKLAGSRNAQQLAAMLSQSCLLYTSPSPRDS